MAEKIEDFGEKFWGARKDLFSKWKTTGIDYSDFDGSTIEEKLKFIVKKNVLPKIDYNALKENGVSINVIYFYKKIIDSLPAKIKFRSEQDSEEKIKNYISFLKEIQNGLLNHVKKDEDIKDFFHYLESINVFQIKSFRIVPAPQYIDVLENKFLTALQTNSERIANEVKDNLFLFTEEEKIEKEKKSIRDRLVIGKWEKDSFTVRLSEDTTKCYFFNKNTNDLFPMKTMIPKELQKEDFKDNTYFLYDKETRYLLNMNVEDIKSLEEIREKIVDDKFELLHSNENETEEKSRKKRFTPSRVEAITRIADLEWINGDIDEKPYLEELKFRGGEFGNWENQKERQINLNYAYESFKDLAYALGVEESDISGNGKLGIAFGSRGIGSAVAHYERHSDVINLTRMKGAGSLAHEWGHFFDNMLFPDVKSKMASEATRFKSPIKLLEPLFAKIKYKERKRTYEEFEQEKVRKIAEREKILDYYINDNFSLTKLTDKEIEKRQNLVNSLKEDMVKNPLPYSSFAFPARNVFVDEPEKLKDLVSFYRDIKGYTLSKEKRKLISIYADSYSHAKNEEYNPSNVIREHTDFYSGSLAFDKIYAKSDKGYWASDCELFARSFSCYIMDKLEEKNIFNPYLTGHSNLYVSVDSNGKEVRAFPIGEERKAINQEFDKLIETIKEQKEIFHAKNYEIESLKKKEELQTFQEHVLNSQKQSKIKKEEPIMENLSDAKIVFCNDYNKKTKRDLTGIYHYFKRHGIYESKVENFTCEYRFKEKLSYKFGNYDETFTPGEKLLLLNIDGNVNRTKFFDLTNDEIAPSMEELEMMIKTDFVDFDEFDSDEFNYYLKKEVVEEDYAMNHNFKNMEKEKKDEEPEKTSILKASIMLHDFYLSYDENYEKKINGMSDLECIQILNNRLNESAVADLANIEKLERFNPKMASSLSKLISKNCLDKTDWTKKIVHLRDLINDWEKDWVLNNKDLKENGCFVGDLIDLEKAYGFIFNKWEDVVQSQIKKINDIASKKEVKINIPDLLLEKNAKRDYKVMSVEVEDMNKALLQVSKQLDVAIKEKAAKEELKAKETALKEMQKQKTEADLKKEILTKKKQLEALNIDLNFLTRDFARENHLIDREGNKDYKAINDFLSGLLEKKDEKQRLLSAIRTNDNQHDFKSPDAKYVNNFAYETNCPKLLLDRRCFCVWKTEWRERTTKKDGKEIKIPRRNENGDFMYDAEGNLLFNEGHWAKAPFQPRLYLKNGESFYAKANDERTWGTYQEACEAVRKSNGEFCGIGIFTGKSICCIDIDHCIDENGRISSFAKEEIKNAYSYSEISPSGTGVHIFLFADMEGSQNIQGSAAPVELYGSNHFITFTGNFIKVNDLFSREELRKRQEDNLRVSHHDFISLASRAEGTPVVRRIIDEYKPEDKAFVGTKVIIDWGNKNNSLGLSDDVIVSKLISQGERRAKKELVWDDKRGAFVKNAYYDINIEKRLLEGDWQGLGYPSQSEADMSLLGKIWYYTDCPAQVAAIFESSGLYRDKLEKGLMQTNIRNMIGKNISMVKYDSNWKENKIEKIENISLTSEKEEVPSKAVKKEYNQTARENSGQKQKLIME